jgi:hypothetical protein
MALEKEVATYKRELPKLMANAGKHALIQGEGVAGIWETYHDALQEGYRLFGLQPFLVKKIQAVENVHFFTQDVRPLCQS